MKQVSAERMREAGTDKLYGVPALAGTVFALEVARNISKRDGNPAPDRLKPGLHTFTHRI